jgi:hypothetical protein
MQVREAEPDGSRRTAIVIAGLDPAIHPVRWPFLRRTMGRGSNIFARRVGQLLVICPPGGGDKCGALSAFSQTAKPLHLFGNHKRDCEHVMFDVTLAR